MEAQTCPPPDLKAEARAANERHEKAKAAFATAQTELIQSERAARYATNAYFKTIYPDWGIS